MATKKEDIATSSFYFCDIYNKKKIMKKIVRLTENDLTKLIKRVIKEQDTTQKEFCKSGVVGTLTQILTNNNTYDWAIKSSDGKECLIPPKTPSPGPTQTSPGPTQTSPGPESRFPSIY